MMPTNYAECIKFLDNPDETKKFEGDVWLKMPSCKRIVTVRYRMKGRLATHRYFLKFPELAFCFSIKANSHDGIEALLPTKEISMRCFYHDSVNLYGCILPNQNPVHKICFGMLHHYTKKFTKFTDDKWNTKQVVKNCIDDFFCNSFDILHGEHTGFEIFEIDLILYQLYNSWKSHEFFSKEANKFVEVPKDFCMSSLDFFEYWQSHSNEPNFKIFSNDFVKSKPYSTEGLESVITLNQFLKL